MSGYVHGATRGRPLGPGVRRPEVIETDAARERKARKAQRATNREIRAWTERNRVVQEEYRRTRDLVDWFAADPYGTREIARRHANTLDTAPPSA
jgi:hypothetical protein